VEARSAGAVKLGLVGRLGSVPAGSVNAGRMSRVLTLRSRVVALLVVVLLAGVVAAVGCVAVLLTRPGGAPRRTARTRSGLTSLPLAAQGPVSAALGREEPAYRVAGLQAINPAQRLRAGFARAGVTVVSGKARLGMALSAYGYAGAPQPVGSAQPRVSANRVTYTYTGLTTWYANGPLGLEQGFAVAHAPTRGAVGPLTVSLAISGNVTPKLTEGGRGLTFARAGHTVLRYSALQATDSRGRVLRSWLALEPGRIVLRVDTAGARYPLRIDPLIQQGEKLAGAGEIASGRFGYSVALSADGNTALIGARYAIRNNNEAGGAWVFTRSGSTWTQQGGKLNGTGHAGETLFDHIGEGAFGYSVALSADGNTALIGAPDDDGGATNEGGVGAVWVFTRSGSTWTQQGEKLTGTGETGKGEFGKSVVLSADGTALIGAPADNGEAGAVWVFTRSGSTWTQQGEKLVGDCTASCTNEGTGETGEGMFGTSVALSEDGETAVVSGPADSGGAGAAWVFTRSDGVWAQQGEKLVGDCTASCANEGTGETGKGEFGKSVVLSADGDTTLIGAPADSGGVGAVWVFTRSGSTWTQQGEKLIGDCTSGCTNEGAGETGEGKFGTSVALAEDGETAMIGGPGDSGGVGAVWVFTRSGSTWSEQGEKLTGTGESGEGEFGYSVALSEDGNTALIGGPEDDTATGAVWAFTRSSGAWSQQGQKLTGGEEGNSQFGVYVALSADGDTALIGGPGDNYDAGAAWVFTRSGGVWSQQGPKLTGRGETREDGFGVSVALSADGNTALIGAPGDNGGLFGKGAAWVFTRSDGVWTQQGEKLVGDCTESCANEGTGEIYNAWFGYNVALSADGNTALIGGFRDNDWRGAAWVFTRSGSTWSQQGEKLVGDCTSGCANEGTGEVGDGMFGTMVALSADGNTALIGAWNDDNTLPGNDHYSGEGAVWVFTRSGSTWTQQGEKLVGDCTSGCTNEGTGEVGEGKFGTSVALSADGNTAMVGGWDDDDSRGAAWVFTRSGSTWTQQGEKLVGDCTSGCTNEGTGETGEGRFGVSEALSADGDTAMIAGLDDNGTRGAVWMFTRTGSTWTEQGEKITGGGEAGEGEFGTNVVLSADGDTALVGAWRDNGGRGAAWVFVDPPTTATGAATGVGESGATLNGTLGGGGSSSAYFQYGTTAAYGASTAIQSVGVSSSPSPLAGTIEGLAPGTTYHFRLVAENSGGVVYGADQTFTTEARGGVSTTGSTTTTTTQTTSSSPSVLRETPPPAPALQDVSQSATRWREGNQLARISRAKTPTGTNFSFSLNEQAAVTFGFTQRVSGREVSGKCVAQTEKNRRKSTCRRTVTAGTLTFTGHSGTDKVAFQGRISAGTKLEPGSYTLVVTATNSAGARSAPKSLSFTIVKSAS
jgi:FG-GAP repeat protein